MCLNETECEALTGIAPHDEASCREALSGAQRAHRGRLRYHVGWLRLGESGRGGVFPCARLRALGGGYHGGGRHLPGVPLPLPAPRGSPWLMLWVRPPSPHPLRFRAGRPAVDSYRARGVGVDRPGLVADGWDGWGRGRFIHFIQARYGAHGILEQMKRAYAGNAAPHVHNEKGSFHGGIQAGVY